MRSRAAGRARAPPIGCGGGPPGRARATPIAVKFIYGSRAGHTQTYGNRSRHQQKHKDDAKIKRALDALRGCRARLLGEFARVAAREPPFLSRAAAARVREARRDATEAADDGLFFPFDPCRLPRTKAAVAALFREWAAAEAEESSSSSSDDESGSSDDDAAPMSLATSLHEQDEACDLGDIFGNCNVPRKYHKRTSSGVWQNDRLTSPEEAAYKRQFFGR